MNSFASAPGGTDSLADMMAQLDQQMAAPVRKVDTSVPRLSVRSGAVVVLQSSHLARPCCAHAVRNPASVTDPGLASARSRDWLLRCPGLASGWLLQAVTRIPDVLMLKAVCRFRRRGRHGSSCPPLARWSTPGTGSRQPRSPLHSLLSARNTAARAPGQVHAIAGSQLACNYIFVTGLAYANHPVTIVGNFNDEVCLGVQQR